ncbi:hypothetical protein N7466_001423 [Penicillium verhagenii]|uniref:uncharacterized protein n=1 Tax=Penicillium verhagenii TaxID=1562060 RepID=UPI00254508A7|nr:uncharacterized protein N7466_001423 [Penicillium verhagenii]KAJ5938289.1 hypothetical protein N7466_001423 [Penicillium verhagenii]
MPPTRSQNPIKKQEKLSIRQAAEIYDIPKSTLYDRINGVNNRVESRANSTKLTEIEENSLK